MLVMRDYALATICAESNLRVICIVYLTTFYSDVTYLYIHKLYCRGVYY